MKGRRLKVFQLHLGFYDTIVATPSRKAALEAWGASAGEFAKGFAQVTTDPDAVEPAMAHPGKVLRRPFGSSGQYKCEPDPVPAPKRTARQKQSVAVAATQERKRAAAARKEAERELKTAQQAESREMAELKKRATQLAKEKADARIRAQERIARAKARLVRSSGR
jgi:hypothetical protein